MIITQSHTMAHKDAPFSGSLKSKLETTMCGPSDPNALIELRMALFVDLPHENGYKQYLLAKWFVSDFAYTVFMLLVI